jgi:hypothetical protein
MLAGGPKIQTPPGSRHGSGRLSRAITPDDVGHGGAGGILDGASTRKSGS